jgi:hypothetical protein
LWKIQPKSGEKLRSPGYRAVVRVEDRAPEDHGKRAKECKIPKGLEEADPSMV